MSTIQKAGNVWTEGLYPKATHLASYSENIQSTHFVFFLLPWFTVNIHFQRTGINTLVWRIDSSTTYLFWSVLTVEKHLPICLQLIFELNSLTFVSVLFASPENVRFVLYPLHDSCCSSTSHQVSPGFFLHMLLSYFFPTVPTCSHLHISLLIIYTSTVSSLRLLDSCFANCTLSVPVPLSDSFYNFFLPVAWTCLVSTSSSNKSLPCACQPVRLTTQNLTLHVSTGKKVSFLAEGSSILDVKGCNITLLLKNQFLWSVVRAHFSTKGKVS